MTRANTPALPESLLMERPPFAAGALLGLEHEYRVSMPGGGQADFREWLHRFPVPGRRIDPGDINAYRLPSGLALTADGMEAEVATPPLPVGPGFTEVVQGWAAHGRTALAAALPAGWRLEGYSTHISVSVPEGYEDAVAAAYARTFAPAFALLAESPASHGIYVRPRPGRLELCCEFVDGPRLGAVAAFAVGSTRACFAAQGGDGPSPLPALALDLRPSEERHGIRVHRTAAGFDLYAAGRAAVLPLAGGGIASADDLLRRAWAAAAGCLAGLAVPDDLRVAEAMAAGRLPLGVEGWPEVAPQAPACAPTSSWGDICAPVHDGGGLRCEAVAGTWAWTLFRVRREGEAREVYGLVPGEALASFLAAVRAGGLDELVGEAVRVQGSLPARPDPRRRALQFSTQPPPLASLVLPERPVPAPLHAATAAKTSRAGKLMLADGAPGPGTGASVRVGKREGRVGKAVLPPTVPVAPARPVSMPPGLPPPPAPPLVPKGHGFPWLIVPLVGLLAAVVVAAAVIASVSGGDSDAPPSSTPALATTPARATETPSPAHTATATAARTATPTRPAETVVPTTAVTATATATPQPSPTPAVDPTRTPVPTETPVPTATPTPRPVATPTPSPTRTAAPTPTATPLPPTATPTRVPVSPTATPACTPGAGVACPTPTPSGAATN